MALSKLSGDEKRTIFVQLCDVFDPGVAVAFSSTSNELRTLTQAERQQLQADYEAATALSQKAGKGGCKELSAATRIWLEQKGVCPLQKQDTNVLSVKKGPILLLVTHFGATINNDKKSFSKTRIFLSN